MSKDQLQVSLQNEKELIHLLLNNKNAIESFLESGLSHKHFREEHQSVVAAILESYEIHDVLLTRKSFRDKLQKCKVPKDRISQELAFNSCYAAYANVDDLPLLINKVLEENIQISINEILDRFAKRATENNLVAIKQLVDDCNGILDGTTIFENKTYYEDIRILSKERTQYLQDVRDGKIKEEPRIITGIKEIDYTMVTGLEKGTLTLICADVGGFKSSMMINISLNVWHNGHSVLFVPLEMHRDQMWIRICSRETRLPGEIFTRDVKNMTDDQMRKIHEMNKEWEERSAKFYIMEESGNTSVIKIQRQIERHISIIKPRLVVIDYVANLEAHKERYGRNDLEIGDMLKTMRQMGKDLNFAVLSGAQLGRQALNRLRKVGADRDKPTINSEDIRGSHEYAADADNIYAQLQHPQQPHELLDLYVVKARNGPTVFENGRIRATLDIHPEIGLIQSPSDFQGIDDDADDILGDLVDKTENDISKKGSFFEEDDDIFDYEYSSNKKNTSVQYDEDDDEW